MKNDYKITREKFFDTEERKTLLRVTEANALLDRKRGLMTWQIRWMLVHLAMFSGLRVSEIGNLKIGDLHLQKNGSPYIFVRHGKRGKDRDVYIDPELVAHLKEFIKEKKELWDQPNGKNDYLFTGRGGKKMSTTALSISFTNAVKEAGLWYKIPKKLSKKEFNLSIHSARHTYATFIYATTKGNLKFVQKQLGHSTIIMTSLYADILPEENSKLANSILNE